MRHRMCFCDHIECCKWLFSPLDAATERKRHTNASYADSLWIQLPLSTELIHHGQFVWCAYLRIEHCISVSVVVFFYHYSFYLCLIANLCLKYVSRLYAMYEELINY